MLLRFSSCPSIRPQPLKTPTPTASGDNTTPCNNGTTAVTRPLSTTTSTTATKDGALSHPSRRRATSRTSSECSTPGAKRWVTGDAEGPSSSTAGGASRYFPRPCTTVVIYTPPTFLALHQAETAMGTMFIIHRAPSPLLYLRHRSNPQPPCFHVFAIKAAEKPSFRRLVGRRHGVVAFTGFYEWKRDEKGERQPYYFYFADGRPLLVRGRAVCSACPLPHSLPFFFFFFACVL